MEFKLVFRPDDFNQFKKYLGNLKKTDKIIAKNSQVRAYLNSNSIDFNNIIESEVEAESLRESVVIESKVNFKDFKNSDIINRHFGALEDYININPSKLFNSQSNNDKVNSELIPALMIMDVVFCVENHKGKKVISLDEYLRNSKVKESYNITEIIAGKRNGNSGFHKLRENEKNITAAVYLEMNNNKVKTFKAALGGAGIKPFRVYEIENLVAGKDEKYLLNDRIIHILSKKINENIYKEREADIKEKFEFSEIKNVYIAALKKVFNRLNIECN